MSLRQEIPYGFRRNRLGRRPRLRLGELIHSAYVFVENNPVWVYSTALCVLWSFPGRGWRARAKARRMRGSEIDDLGEFETSSMSQEEALEILHGLCHAFGSAETLQEAVESTVRWIRSALGEDVSAVRVFLPSARGRALRLSAGDPDPYEKRSVQARSRLHAFQSKTHARTLSPSRPSDDHVFVVPLVSRGLALGALEIECTPQRFEERQRLVEAVVSQAAIVFRNLRFRTELADRIGALELSIDRAIDEDQRKTHQLEMGLAWAAHEFCGPVASVQMVLDHLRKKIQNDGRGSLDLMRRSREQLSYVGSIVDVMLKGVVTQESLERSNVDLVDVVQLVIHEHAWEQGEDRVVYEGPERLPAYVDAGHLRGAIANVVRNALLYSGEGTPVKVRMSSSADSVTIRVSDEGPGIPEEQRESVFYPFTRGDAPAETAGGSGIGLYITKRVVEAHGGTVEVTNGEEGRGATFVLDLPSPGASARGDRLESARPA